MLSCEVRHVEVLEDDVREASLEEQIKRRGGRRWMVYRRLDHSFYEFDEHRERGIPRIPRGNKFMRYLLNYRRSMSRLNVILKHHNHTQLLSCINGDRCQRAFS